MSDHANTTKRLEQALITITLLLALNFAAKAEGSAAQPARPESTAVATIEKLAQGQPVRREIGGEARHSFQVDLSAGQFLHITVEQQEIDVNTKLFGPDGKELLALDSRATTRGIEPIYWIARADGAYRVEIGAAQAKTSSGHFLIAIAALRTATTNDEIMLAAQEAFSAGVRLNGEELSESFQQAVKKFDAALQLWRKAGSSADEINTLIYKIAACASICLYKEALTSAESLLALTRSSGDKQTEMIALHLLSGLRNQRGERKPALALCEQALQLARTSADRYYESLILNTQVEIYIQIGELEKASETVVASLEIMVKYRDQAAMANIIGNAAYMTASSSNYQQALELLNRAREFAGNTKSRNLEGSLLIALGATYNNLGDYGKAISNLTKGLTIKQQTGDCAHAALALSHIGFNYRKQQLYRKADEYFESALAIARTIEDKYLEIYLLGNLALTNLDQRKFEKALLLFNEALPLARALNDRDGEASIIMGIGTVIYRQGDKKQALDYLRQALPLFQAVGNRNGEAICLSNIAQVQCDVGQLEAALETLNKAKEYFTNNKAASDGELRSTFSSTSHSLLNVEIDILMQLHKRAPDKGYDGKALLLYEQTQSGILYDKISTRNGSASKARPAVSVTVEKIQQALLDDNTLLLEFLIDPDHSYLWVVTRHSVRSFELPEMKDFEEIANNILLLIYARNRLKRGLKLEIGGFQFPDSTLKADAELNSALERLSNKLLAPIADQLKAQRLIIVTNNLTQLLPFTAMTVPGRKRPLIIDHEVVLLPSVSILDAIRERAAQDRPTANTIAVIADPVFSVHDPRVRSSARNPDEKDGEDRTRGLDLKQIMATEAAIAQGLRDQLKEIPRLPGTRVEASRILAFVPAYQRKSVIGFDANRNLVLSDALNNYQIIHFATHGFINIEQPELSGIMLSLVNEQGHRQEGILFQSDISKLKLSAELVVLSACQTGLGKNNEGSDAIGIGSSFLLAGAKSVIASLWNVNDAATAEFMSRFYRNLLVGKMRPAAALRAAQVSMWKTARWRSPYYWAAFQLQGEYK